MLKHLILVMIILNLSSKYYCNEVIIQLENKNFESFVKSNNYTLINFYSNSCLESKEIENMFNKLHQELKKKKLNFQLAKVDGLIQEEIVSQYSVEQLPTLRLFSSSMEWREFQENMTLSNVLSFLDKYTNKSIIEIDSIEEFKNLEKSGKLFTIACVSDKSSHINFKIYDEVMSLIDGVSHTFTKNEELKKELNCFGSNRLEIFLIKDYEDRRINFEYYRFNKTRFFNWVTEKSKFQLPLLTGKALNKNISNYNKLVILLLSNENKDLLELMYFQSKLKSKSIHFSYLLEESELKEQIVNYFGMGNVTLPAIIAIDSRKDGIHKFKYQFTNFSDELINEWVNDLIDDKLTKYVLSEEMPLIEYEDGVKKIVGNSFKKEILENENDVILLVYSPYNHYCQEFEPKYLRLAQKLSKNSNLTIAKIDGIQNEIDGLNFQAFPTIFFFRGGQTGTNKFSSVSVINASGNITEIITTLKSSCYHALAYIDEIENEKLIEEDEKLNQMRDNLDFNDFDTDETNLEEDYSNDDL